MDKLVERLSRVASNLEQGAWNLPDKFAPLVAKDIRATITALSSTNGDDGERRAPVQGFSAGIPWDMHLRAYDAYCAKYRKQEALIEGGCRGGFSTGELDVFIPGWRDELDGRAKLQAEVASLNAQLERMRVLVHESLFHLRLDEPAQDYHNRALAALNPIGEGGLPK